MISNERLEEIASGVAFGFDLSERTAVAKELLAYRKAFSGTAVYEAEINGVMSSVTKSHYED